MTNRDMAAALSVSLKTVEANLTRIYRKLGIRSRAELGERMAQRTADGPTNREVAGSKNTASQEPRLWAS
jgi:FixJ family two-component response regulator